MIFRLELSQHPFLSASAFSALLIFLTISPLMAAEIARVTVDGRAIVLNDDKTWAYAEEGAVPANANSSATNTDCTRLEAKVVPLTFCLDPKKWALATINDEAEVQFRLRDQELYVLLIGEKEVIPMDSLKTAILTNAQNASGLKPVVTQSDEPAIVDGRNFTRIAYQSDVEGTNYSYVNYFASMDGKGSVQIFFLMPTDVAGSMGPQIDEVIAGVIIPE